MASTFKYIADEFPNCMGAVSGIVGMVGGFGGFSIRSCSVRFWICSACIRAASYVTVWVSLTLNYLTEVRRAPVMGEAMLQCAA
jgi:NNP family nitrate/nitrite transporter-like MFS transporter